MDEIKIDCFEGYTGAKYLMHFMDEIIKIVSECEILQVSSESNHAKEQAKISAYNEIRGMIFEETSDGTERE